MLTAPSAPNPPTLKHAHVLTCITHTHTHTHTHTQVEQTANLNRVVQDYHQHSRQDHRAALQRKLLIEARKEFIESQSKNKVGGLTM